MAKAKYLTSKQLGILPEERKALIAFATAPALGRLVAVNGQAHYYDQGDVDDKDIAKEHECGTAGCVAGYVFAHARVVQKRRTLRGATTPYDYIEAAWATDETRDEYGWKPGVARVPVLANLYGESGERTLKEARKVVTKMLQTGKVVWRG